MCGLAALGTMMAGCVDEEPATVTQAAHSISPHVVPATVSGFLLTSGSIIDEVQVVVDAKLLDRRVALDIAITGVGSFPGVRDHGELFIPLKDVTILEIVDGEALVAVPWADDQPLEIGELITSCADYVQLKGKPGSGKTSAPFGGTCSDSGPF